MKDTLRKDTLQLLRKDRQRRQGGGIDLYVHYQLECLELCLGIDEELTENLWIQVKGRTCLVEIIVGVCYKPCDQED